MIRVPDRYLDDFNKGQMLFAKTRVALLCSLSFTIYFLAMVIWFFLYPQEFSSLEILTGIVLLAVGSVVLTVNSRASRFRDVKLNAYLFTAFLLVLLVKLGIAYEDSAAVSSASFVFSLFLISVTIPWNPGAVILLGLMHHVAYTFSFFYLRHFHAVNPESFSIDSYLDGAIFIAMGVFLCWVIRRHEAERDVENFLLLKQVEQKNLQLTRELDWATRIHKTIIPPDLNNDAVSVAVTYLPAYYIGGDYVRYDLLDHDRMIFIISDVTGHGVSAALLVNRIHAEFQRFAKEGKMPGELLKELNVFIKEDFEGSDMYLTAFCGMLDLKKMTLSYSNYGHPPQYLYRAEKAEVEPLGSLTCMLGVPIDDNDVYEKKLQLDKGDRIMLYTDGITETIDAEGQEYGQARLENFIRLSHNIPVKAVNLKLLVELNAFKSGKFRDDICLMDMEIKGRHGLFPRGS